jgi:uncharacterized membrane protein YjjP (DUF1212 family)
MKARIKKEAKLFVRYLQKGGALLALVPAIIVGCVFFLNWILSDVGQKTVGFEVIKGAAYILAVVALILCAKSFMSEK